VFLVDIRPAAQREQEGGIHGSLIIERNVLEFSLDPRSDARLSIVDRYDLRVIVFCQEGDASSLAAISLHELGLLNATDIIGGYAAWKEAGLPVDSRPPAQFLVHVSHPCLR
jgi:rhodanese-related sulfurtransferase